MGKKKAYIDYSYEDWIKEEAEGASDDLKKKKLSGEYLIKEIRSGTQLECEIYPKFDKQSEIPIEYRRKKDNRKAMKNLNDKNARKYVERLINANFTDSDLWITFTYDDAHLPEDIEDALDYFKKFLRRVNYKRKKKGLPKAKYIYVTEYDPHSKIRFHHHLVMDGLMSMDEVEACWGMRSRNELRRLTADDSGYSGIANYITKQKRKLNERRWNSSSGLKKPDVKIRKSKPRVRGSTAYRKMQSFMESFRKDNDDIRQQALKWFPDYDFIDFKIRMNPVNNYFYVWFRLKERYG